MMKQHFAAMILGGTGQVGGAAGGAGSACAGVIVDA